MDCEAKDHKYFPLLFYLYQTVPQKWLTSPDNLTPIYLDVFDLTFIPVVLQMLTYLFPHMDSIIIFREGWMLLLLLGEVCFDLDIWADGP